MIIPTLTPEQFEAALRRQIKGALKACLSDHGTITKDLIGSVLKRLENQPMYQQLIGKTSQQTNP